MAYANGHIPRSVLAPIPGSSPRPGGKPLLRKDAARAYNALHRYAMRRWGISMALSEGSIRRAYREFSAQQAAYRQYGPGMAARPGTSNHGLGINVDLMNRRQRWVIDQVGHQFGFSKRWSDAAHEWWHVTYRPGKYPLVARYAPSRLPALRLGSRGPSVLKLKKMLYENGIRGFSTSPQGSPSNNRYDKRFTVHTKLAVQRLQKRKRLTADGVVGPSTWRALR